MLRIIFHFGDRRLLRMANGLSLLIEIGALDADGCLLCFGLSRQGVIEFKIAALGRIARRVGRRHHVVEEKAAGAVSWRSAPACRSPC